MGSDALIRTMRFRDIPRILAIERECFPLNNSLGMLLYHWLFDREAVLVAESAGEVIGYVLARRTLSGRLSHHGHIAALAVLPAFRRRGIGRNLMNAALNRLTERNAETVALEVRCSNVIAQALYEKLGFKRTEVLRRYYFDGEDAFRMLKRLSPASPGEHRQSRRDRGPVTQETRN